MPSSAGTNDSVWQTKRMNSDRDFAGRGDRVGETAGDLACEVGRRPRCGACEPRDSDLAQDGRATDGSSPSRARPQSCWLKRGVCGHSAKRETAAIRERSKARLASFVLAAPDVACQTRLCAFLRRSCDRHVDSSRKSSTRTGAPTALDRSKVTASVVDAFLLSRSPPPSVRSLQPRPWLPRSLRTATPRRATSRTWTGFSSGRAPGLSRASSLAIRCAYARARIAGCGTTGPRRRACRSAVDRAMSLCRARSRPSCANTSRFSSSAPGTSTSSTTRAHTRQRSRLRDPSEPGPARLQRHPRHRHGHDRCLQPQPTVPLPVRARFELLSFPALAAGSKAG